MRRRILALLLPIVFFASCVENNLAVDPVVLTEQILFVGGEQARLAGRLVATGEQSVSEHGFDISTDESFSNTITISLGTRSKPGRFIGEITDLIGGQQYYWKPFTIIDGSRLEGEVSQFTTLEAEISFYEPLISSAGQFIFITGKNFTSESRVFFDDREANVLEVEKESLIRATIPSIGDKVFSTVSVVSQNQTLVAEVQFEYIIGEWEEIGEFPEPNAFSQNVAIKSGDDFYFGLGISNSLNYTKIWKYNVPTMEWTNTGYEGETIGPFNGNGYFGGGITQLRNGTFINTIKELQGGSFVETLTFPFNNYNGISYRKDDFLYILGGLKENDLPNFDVWRYTFSTGEWEIVGSVPVTVNETLPRFEYNGEIYFVDPQSRLFRLNIETLTLTELAPFPSGTIENGLGVSERIGDKAYIGLFGDSRAIWEYDITNDSWKSKSGLTRAGLTRTVASFVQGDIVYVLKNPASPAGSMSIWKFDPEAF